MKAKEFVCLIGSAAAVVSVPLFGAEAKDTLSPALEQSKFALIATFSVQQGKQDQFVEAMDKNVVASRKEPGVLLYQDFQKGDDPQTFYNVEIYRDKDAFDAHLKSEHVAAAGKVFDQILTKPIEVVPVQAPK